MFCNGHREVQKLWETQYFQAIEAQLSTIDAFINANVELIP